MAEMGYELSTSADRAIVQAALGVPSVFNVLAYGAVADSDGVTTGSGTDCKAAVDAAIVAASVAGGKVWFPPGTYRYAGPRLRVAASNVVIDGPGAKLFFDTTDIYHYGRVLFDGGVFSGEIRNVGIRNIAVTSLAGPNQNQLANDPLGGDPQAAPACIVTMRGCANFSVSGCDLSGSAGWTVHVYRSRDGRVCFNELYGAIADGVHVTDGSSDVIVLGNNIHDCGDDGVAVGYSGALCKDIIIQANTIKNVGACGVAIYAPSVGVQVLGNIINTTWLSGIKLTPLSVVGGASNRITDVLVSGNKLSNIGTRSAALFSRGQGISCGIAIDPEGGALDRIKIDGNQLYNVRNGFVWVTSTGGSIGTLTIKDNDCDTIASTAVAAVAASGGGAIFNPPDGIYAAIKAFYAANLIVSANTTNGCRDAAVHVAASVMFARVSEQTVIASNAGGSGSVFNLLAGTTVANDNAAAVLAAGVTLKTITNPLLDVNNVSPAQSTATIIIADSSDRADTAPSANALGSTPTGAKAWSVGAGAAGIAGNLAVFGTGGNFPQAVVDTGAPDHEVSVTITPNGVGTRLYAAQNAAAGSQTVTTFASFKDGKLYFYDANGLFELGSFTPITSGTFTARLKIAGAVATLFINGAQVVSYTSTNAPGFYGQGQYAGFGEDEAGGAARFDNFTVATG